MEDAESTADKRKAAELKEDLMRLKRVEQIYVRFNIAFRESHNDDYDCIERRFTCLVRLGSGSLEVVVSDRLSEYRDAAAILYSLRLYTR